MSKELFTESHGKALRTIKPGEILTAEQWEAVCAFVREQDAIIAAYKEFARDPAPDAPSPQAQGGEAVACSHCYGDRWMKDGSPCPACNHAHAATPQRAPGVDANDVRTLVDWIFSRFGEHWNASELPDYIIPTVRRLEAALAAPVSAGDGYQERVGRWMDACFPRALYGDMTQRCDRFLEESLELLQAQGYDRGRVATLVDYVWGRPVGEPRQEVGGTVVTLAALCWVAGIDMLGEAQRELERIERPEVMAKIRAKQEAKNALHFDSPLPGTAALTSGASGVES